jgi:hypothetical protein
MNGFAEAAIGLAFAAHLAALSTLLAAEPTLAPEPPRSPSPVATQKLMRNPWERTSSAFVTPYLRTK